VRERIEAAAALADRGRDERRELLTQEYLTARLTDEIALAGTEGHVSLVIARLRSIGELVAEVGAEGLEHLVRTVVDRARVHLPPGGVLGASGRDEVAAILPGLGPREAYPLVRSALGEVSGEFRFAGGAVVDVEVAAGLATYPDNAADPDGLFMAADAALAEAVEQGTLVQLAL
jgi:GGDEF domain-containing protein